MTDRESTSFTDIQPDSSTGRGDASSTATADSNDRNDNGCCSDTRKACQDCLSTLCCGACIGSVLCCFPMEPTTRVKYIWGLLCVLGVAGGIIFSVVLFGTGYSSPSPTDMRIITHKISSIFCSKLFINSASHITTYSFDENPEVDSYSSETYSTGLNTTFSRDVIYWRFYLLRGSQIALRSCSEADVWVYVIAGTANWGRWSRDMFCPDCYLLEHSLMKTRCSSSDMADVVTLAVNQTDEYFIVYHRMSDPGILQVRLSLDRTLYDVTKATRICTNDASACAYDLRYPLKPYIVYHIDAGPYDGNTRLDTICEPRIWIYFLIFFMCPFIVGAVLSIIVNKIWGGTSTAGSTYRPRPSVMSPTLDSERVHLLGSGRAAYPTYSSIPQPPKYEDIEHGRHSPPPSYEAAMRHPRAGR